MLNEYQIIRIADVGFLEHGILHRDDWGGLNTGRNQVDKGRVSRVLKSAIFHQQIRCRARNGRQLDGFSTTVRKSHILEGKLDIGGQGDHQTVVDHLQIFKGHIRSRLI